MPALFKAADSIGTIHYSRFTVLSEKTLLFLGDFDGEFGATYDRTRQARPDRCSTRSSSTSTIRRPRPVADHVEAFVEWAAEHLVHPLNIYTAYPSVTVKGDQGPGGRRGRQRRRRRTTPVPGDPAHQVALGLRRSQIAAARAGRGTTRDLDTVGTPHFAQFVPLEDNQIGFFTVYDGSFDKYIADFTKNIGEVFDLIFKFTKNPPPSPCRKHLQEFIDFAAGASRTPIGFYQAYPGLTVQDIHALIADSKSTGGRQLDSAGLAIDRETSRPRGHEPNLGKDFVVSREQRMRPSGQRRTARDFFTVCSGRGAHAAAHPEAHAGSATAGAT